MRTDARDSVSFGRYAAGNSRRLAAGLAVAGVLAAGIVTAGCSGTGTKTAANAGPGTPAAVTAALVSSTPTVSMSPTPAVSPTPAAAATPNAALQHVNASTIVAGFKKRSLPVSNSTALNASTDPDGRLGKYRQYTSKVTFADSRVANNGATGIAAGGAVEVFGSQADATRRKNELTQAATANGANGEIDFQRGTIILRLSPRLAADQVSEYETTVNLVLRAALKHSSKHATPATTLTAPPPPGG